MSLSIMNSELISEPNSNLGDDESISGEARSAPKAGKLEKCGDRNFITDTDKWTRLVLLAL